MAMVTMYGMNTFHYIPVIKTTNIDVAYFINTPDGIGVRDYTEVLAMSDTNVPRLDAPRLD